jgi:hypothetical protein
MALLLRVNTIITYFITLLIRIRSEPDTAKGFAFLVEGERLQYGTAEKIIRATFEVEIPFTRREANAIMENYDKLIRKWTQSNTYSTPSTAATTRSPTTIPPSPAETTRLSYLRLLSVAVIQSLQISSLIMKVYDFKDESKTYTGSSSCKYKHSVVLLGEMKTQHENVQFAFGKINSEWTLTEISTDPEKDLVTRTAILTLTTAMEALIENFNELLGLLDALSSNTIPSQLKGHYHRIDCIGTPFEEKLTVLDCTKAKTGYVCDMEITVPTQIRDVANLYPVHYSNIRVRGSTIHDRFVLDSKTKSLHTIVCDHYEFNTEDLPMCHSSDLDESCGKALMSNDIEDTIASCPLVKHTPPAYGQTKDKGYLIQGTDLYLSKMIGDDYSRINFESPAIVFSPVNLKVHTEEAEFILTATMPNTSEYSEIKSLLTKDQVEQLESKESSQRFWESFDFEDHMENMILGMQIVVYPLTFLGIGLGIASRMRLTNVMGSLSNKKLTAYANNKRMLKG